MSGPFRPTAVDDREPVTSVWTAEGTAGEAAELQGWLGYESIHPLTWVPESSSEDRPQGTE